MVKKVRCIESFDIERIDDDGFVIESEYFTVEKRSVWDVKEDKYRLVDGEVRLEREGVGSFAWMEITKEMLTEYFEELEG